MRKITSLASEPQHDHNFLSKRVLALLLGVVSKQLIMLRGRVLDSTILVISLKPKMRLLVEDAVASCCSDIVGHFGLIRNEL